MEKISRVDRIRLATALCALQLKPRSQSITAYVFDLRNAFPAPNVASSRNQPWKSRLRELEKRISQLEAELDAEKIRSITKGATSTGPTAEHPPSPESSAGARLKKGRKKHLPAKDRVDKTASRLHSPDWRSLHKNNPPPAAFPTVDTFVRLVSLDNPSLVKQDTIISVTLRSVNAIANSLHSLLVPERAHQLEDKKHLKVLNALLQYVLAHGPALLLSLSEPLKRKRKRDVIEVEMQAEPIHSFLEVLRDGIFIPAITAIYHLSNVYLTRLLISLKSPTTSASNKEGVDAFWNSDHGQDTLVDLRQDLLDLLEDNFHLLYAGFSLVAVRSEPSWKMTVSNFYMSLALATISKLDEAILGRPHGNSPSDTSPPISSRDADGYPAIHLRVKHLATKDSVWYLCSILHLLLDGVLASKERIGREPPSRETPNHSRGGSKGTNNQQAYAILAHAAEDILFTFMTKIQLGPAKTKDYEGDWANENGQYSHDNIQMQIISQDIATHGDFGQMACPGQRNEQELPYAAVDAVSRDMILGVIERFVFSTL